MRFLTVYYYENYVIIQKFYPYDCHALGLNLAAHHRLFQFARHALDRGQIDNPSKRIHVFQQAAYVEAALRSIQNDACLHKAYHLNQKSNNGFPFIIFHIASISAVFNRL